MDISVTFPTGPAGPLALVRFKCPGDEPIFRTLPLAGSPEESARDLEAFIWSHVDGPACWQGWLWEE